MWVEHPTQRNTTEPGPANGAHYHLSLGWLVKLSWSTPSFVVRINENIIDKDIGFMVAQYGTVPVIDYCTVASYRDNAIFFLLTSPMRNL